MTISQLLARATRFDALRLRGRWRAFAVFFLQITAKTAGVRDGAAPAFSQQITGGTGAASGSALVRALLIRAGFAAPALPVLPVRFSAFGEGFGAFDVVLAFDIGLRGRVGRSGHCCQSIILS